MTITNGGNLGLFENAANGEAHGAALRAFLRGMDFFGEPTVKEIGTNTPPASPANGDAYVVGTSPTGAWAGKANNIARYSTIAAGWEFYAPKQGWKVFDGSSTSGTFYTFNGTTWDGVLYANYGVKISGDMGNFDALVFDNTNATNPHVYKLGPGVCSSTTFGLRDSTRGVNVLTVDNATGLLTINYGINLGGTVNLSAYDEGTWTPTVANISGTGITYTCKWARVGNRVDFNILINGTNVATTTTTTLTLPFTPAINGACSVTTGNLVNCGCGAIRTDGKVYTPAITDNTNIVITGTFFLN